jgi:hypothetical protein
MGQAEEIRYTVSTFQRVLTVEKHRMAMGTTLRNYIQSQLAEGKEPNHYRMEWMHRGISRCIRFLEEFSREFNDANPTDKFSTADMIDIVNGADKTLRDYLEDTND